MSDTRTITNCPTCGSSVTVGGEGETHFYIPLTENTPKTQLALDGWNREVLKNAEYIRQNAELKASLDEAQKALRAQCDKTVCVAVSEYGYSVASIEKLNCGKCSVCLREKILQSLPKRG